MKAATAVVAKTQAEGFKREPFEAKLQDSQGSLTVYMEYILFEQTLPKGGDQFAIRSLFERAICAHPLQESIWDAYITFLIVRFNIPHITASACHRAVRNCMYSATLWSHYLNIQRNQADLDGTAIMIQEYLIKRFGSYH